jgi:5'-nucleotidase (lipoprotein e(P4) family)
MKTKNYLLTFGLVACSVVSTYFAATTHTATAQQAIVQKGTADNEYQTGGVLYMQTAGEYRALAYQAFNLAKISLDMDEMTKKKLPKSERRRARAVMVDIDETILDNSQQQAFSIKNRLPFNLQNWYAWGELRQAKAIPGAVDFLNYASKKGVRIFYSSNRDEVQKAATIENLKNVGFPDVSPETVLLRTNESSKEPRRLLVLQKYRLVLLMGDNLNDFSDVFEKKSINDRFSEVDKARDSFGTRWIVLPNAMYGDWENAIYDYKRLTEAEKTAKRNSALMAY